MTEGPFKGILEEKDLSRFVSYAPASIWRSCYDFGSCTAWVDESERIHVQLKDLPWVQTYFEFGVMGHYHGILETFVDGVLTSNKEDPPMPTTVYCTFAHLRSVV